MRRGTTVVELMVVAILLTLIMGAMYKVFRGSQEGAREITANQVINDDVLRLVNRLTDDLREANFVDPNLPPTLDAESGVAALKTDDATNMLMFTKVKYDFTKAPPTSDTDDRVNYTQLRVVYSLTKADRSNATGPYILWREGLPFNDRRQAQTADKTKFKVMDNIDRLVFYRLKNPNAPRSGNVFLQIRMTRLDKTGTSAQKYTMDVTTSVKERGAEPE